MRPREASKDYYWRLAKERGYLSRAAFKLVEIQDRFKVMRRGDRVVDLGCHPGGWLQVASKVVSREGLIVGVDLKEPLVELDNVMSVVSDVQDPELPGKLAALSPFGYDVLLSDLSPNISGVWELDHYRQIDLSRTALATARRLLKANGNAVFKVFHGGEEMAFVREVREDFRYVSMFKPRASRPQSSEIYAVALGFNSRGGTAAPR